MAIFIHHLCSYRWSVLRRSMLMFPCGSDVQLSEYTDVDNSVSH
ncbi:hypothetical protein AtNW77_Chr4g0290371 [Arabidopsis thaliana]